MVMRGSFLLLLPVCCVTRLAAQDAFEIHVYEYEPLSRGQHRWVESLAARLCTGVVASSRAVGFCRGILPAKYAL
jgi:hypothetical protein